MEEGTHQTRASEYHPELDRLRFFACLAVFLHHSLSRNPASYAKFGAGGAHLLSSIVITGSLGVDLFFCLSSFLITTLLLREYELNGRLHVRAFWARRILRIWPLYYAFVAFAAVAVPWILPGDQLRGPYLVGFLFFFGNFVCVTRGFSMSVADPLWSVSVEEQFYLLWPLLLSLASPRRLPYLAGACLALASLSRAVIVHLGLADPAIWCNTLARLDPIALGALLAVLTQRRRLSFAMPARIVLIPLAMVLPWSCIFVWGGDAFIGWSSLVFYPVTALCCALILAACFKPAGAEAPESRSWLNGALVYLGRISYGLYVIHYFSIHWVERLLRQHGGVMRHELAFLGLRTVLAAGLTVGLAALCYRFLEQPFLRLKRRFTYVNSSPTPAGRTMAGSIA